MKDKQKLWIISEIFYPDQTTTAYILTEIARYMTKYYDVNVLCGPKGYEPGNVTNRGSENLKGVRIVRCSCFIRNKNQIFLRTLRQIILTLKFVFRVIFTVPANDKVLMVTNPAPLLLVMAVVRCFKRIELNVLVHDVFPENTLPAGIFKSSDHFLYRIIKSLFSRAYARADRLIVLGRDMKEVIREKIRPYRNHPMIAVVENWADTEAIFPLEKGRDLSIEIPARIILGYAGNYGRVQGLMKLLNVADHVRNKRVCFRFWGSGAMEQEMRNFVTSHKLTNVEINGGYNRDEQLYILNSFDVAFVSLETGMYGLCVPSKTYNLLAAGKPIIFMGDKNSEVARMILEQEIGWVFDESGTEELEDFLNQWNECRLTDLEMKKRKCRQLAETRYAKRVILEKFYSVIK